MTTNTTATVSTANLTPAQTEIATTYNRLERESIAEYGCASGTASSHIYYTETTAFFNRYQGEIEDHLYDTIGEDWLRTFAPNSTGITNLINDIAWYYIEIICNTLPAVDYV